MKKDKVGCKLIIEFDRKRIDAQTLLKGMGLVEKQIKVGAGRGVVFKPKLKWHVDWRGEG